jgi:hypothetical protein
MMLLQAGQLGLTRMNSIWTDVLPPDMVSGATMWLDFTDTDWNYANDDLTGGHVTTDGGVVKSVADKVNSNRRISRYHDLNDVISLKQSATPSGGPAVTLGSIDANGLHARIQTISTNTDTPISAIVSTTTKLVFAAVKVNAATNNDWSQPWLFDAILGDSGSGYFNLGLTDDGSVVTAHAYNWSGSSTLASMAIPRSQYVVLCLSHQSGQLRLRVNGGAWATVTSGTTDNLDGTAACRITSSGAGRIELAHIAVVNTAQTDAAISAVEHWIANDLGITPWW